MGKIRAHSLQNACSRPLDPSHHLLPLPSPCHLFRTRVSELHPPLIPTHSIPAGAARSWHLWLTTTANTSRFLCCYLLLDTLGRGGQQQQKAYIEKLRNIYRENSAKQGNPHVRKCKNAVN